MLTIRSIPRMCLAVGGLVWILGGVPGEANEPGTRVLFLHNVFEAPSGSPDAAPHWLLLTAGPGEEAETGGKRPVAGEPGQLERWRGSLRIVGPDGKVHEHAVGSLPAAELERLKRQIQKLKGASGNPEAVEAIQSELLEMLKQMERPQVGGESKVKYGIGVSLGADVPAVLRSQLRLEEKEGVLVQSVAAGSPAEQAGLREHDLLLKVGGKVISEPGDLIAAVHAAGEASEKVTVEYISGGERKSVELQPRPATDIAWERAVEIAEGDEAVYRPRVWGLKGDPSLAPAPFSIRVLPPGVATHPPGAIPPQIQYYVPPKVEAPASDPAAVKKLVERIEVLEKKLAELSRQLSADESSPRKREPDPKDKSR